MRNVELIINPDLVRTIGPVVRIVSDRVPDREAQELKSNCSMHR